MKNLQVIVKAENLSEACNFLKNNIGRICLLADQQLKDTHNRAAGEIGNEERHNIIFTFRDEADPDIEA